MTIAVGLLKNAYIPVMLLLLAVPSRILAIKLKVSFIGIAAVIGLTWNLLILPVAKEIPEYFNLTENIDSKAQIAYIIEHPRDALGDLLWNVVGTPSILLTPSYNGLIGWGDVPLPFWLSLLSFLTIIFSLLYRDTARSVVKKVQTRLIRSYTGAVFCLSAAAVVLSLYAGWTAVGGRLVSGVQGRYLIPLSFLLVPVITNIALELTAPKNTFAKVIIVMHVIVLAAALTILGMRYVSGIYW
jgi:uncharacterized membrane protein